VVLEALPATAKAAGLAQDVDPRVALLAAPTISRAPVRASVNLASASAMAVTVERHVALQQPLPTSLNVTVLPSPSGMVKCMDPVPPASVHAPATRGMRAKRVTSVLAQMTARVMASVIPRRVFVIVNLAGVATIVGNLHALTTVMIMVPALPRLPHALVMRDTQVFLVRIAYAPAVAPMAAVVTVFVSKVCAHAALITVVRHVTKKHVLETLLLADATVRVCATKTVLAHATVDLVALLAVSVSVCLAPHATVTAFAVMVPVSVLKGGLALHVYRKSASASAVIVVLVWMASVTVTKVSLAPFVS